jgi:TBCC domain-containing protein 1
LTCIAATKRLQVRSCHEGTFYLGITRPPIFIGDNRRNRVAPYNTFYEQLERHLQVAGLSPQCAAWDQPVVIGAPAGAGAGAGSAVEVLPAEKFSPFIVPFRGATPLPGTSPVTQANPFAVPPAYVHALDHKVRSVASLRAALRDAGLDEGSKRDLQATIQAYFKEWLLTSGSMRQIYDLARIERGE